MNEFIAGLIPALALAMFFALCFFVPSFVINWLDKRKKAKNRPKHYKVVIQGVTISYQDLDRILKYTFKNRYYIQDVKLADLMVLNCPKDKSMASLYGGLFFSKPHKDCMIESCHFMLEEDTNSFYIYKN